MKIGDKDKSRIKMVALTQTPHQNVVWWSPVDQNDKSDDFIISGMLRRFEKTPMLEYTNCIMFFDRSNLQEPIRTIKATD